MQLKNLVIPGSNGLPLVIDASFNPDGVPKPVVVFVHGFKGFKDWGHFDHIAGLFADQGFVFVKFNFSHNGTSPDHPDQFVNPEAFGKNNYIIELDDLKKVLDWVGHCSQLKGEADVDRISLIGHSRGGGIAVLKAGEDKRVKKLVTWASVSDFINRNKKKTLDTWKQEGVIYALNSRTGEQLPMYLQFYEIMMANKERLNILRAARHLRIPFLIVHGSADEAVPWHEAAALHKSARHSKLFSLEGAGHTFGVTHPFQPPLPQHAAEVIEKTLRFLKDD